MCNMVTWRYIFAVHIELWTFSWQHSEVLVRFSTPRMKLVALHE